MRLILSLLFLITFTYAQMKNDIPEISSGIESVSIRDGNELYRSYWLLAPEANPDIYVTFVKENETKKVSFITDKDSISFVVSSGGHYDFIINLNGTFCYQRIIGKLEVPEANFDENYRRENLGRLDVLTPEIYELVNIAIAITDLGDSRNFVWPNSKYYSEVKEYFSPFKDHKFISSLDSIFKINRNYYATVKMSGYSFVYDENGQVIPHPNFNRTAFRERRENYLEPFKDELESFSKVSGFRKFYQDHLPFYEAQRVFYKDSLRLEAMIDWMELQFPGTKSYDAVKIFLSPLVSFNQSSTWFESNGFKELHAHVNFPYSDQRNFQLNISDDSMLLYKGLIVFTELNHGYIGSKLKDYDQEIANATSKRNVWAHPEKLRSSYLGNALFNEYMNWGLISLWFYDTVEKKDQELLFSQVEKSMVKNRGFLKFKEFNRFLLDKYRTRKSGTTVSDLYPEIICWFQENNSE